jgi:rubredoxin
MPTGDPGKPFIWERLDLANSCPDSGANQRAFVLIAAHVNKHFASEATG